MKHTKRIFSLALALLMLTLSALCLASCGEKGPFVYVTVADGNGKLVATYEKVAYAEGLTVDGALAALHEEKCKGGYASEKTVYGITMLKLWGEENGGAYGYYVNNASPESLADELKESDHVYAFVYTDTQAFSDAYAFFPSPTLSASTGESIELSLTSSGYDESWTLTNLPVEGAKILIDGEETGVLTDENGKATVKFSKSGKYVVTSKSEGAALSPAFVIVTVK